MPFRLIRADITTLDCDAIVNAANERLQAGGGVCGAIFRAAGASKLQAACDVIGGCATGQSVITPGFGLKARFIIHTVGPIWRGGEQNEEALLRSCYRTALELAEKQRLACIAFPLISSGIYGYPRQAAIETAASEIGAFLSRTDAPEMDVTLVLFDTCSYREGRGLFGDITSYLEQKSAVYQNYQQELSQRRLADELEEAAVLSAPCETEQLTPDSSASQLENWIADRFQPEETFSQSLMRLIDASGETDAAVYKRANVDRRLFSKIRSNPHYQPGKNTALAFCLALRLSLEEAEKLLGKAGYALTHASRFDLAVEYCLRHHIYDVYQVNAVLFDLNLPLLGA